MIYATSPKSVVIPDIEAFSRILVIGIDGYAEICLFERN
jgi:hypothetical protein